VRFILADNLADSPFLRATASNFFFFLSMNAFILLPLYIQRLGGTEVEIGLIMGLYNAVGIVCQPLVGPWVDAVGRRPFMLVGVGFTLAAALAALAAPSIAVLAFVRLLQGIGFSCFFVANYSYVIDLVPPARRGWALGIYGVAGLVGTAVAPLAGEWTIRRFGFRPLFAAAAVVIVIAGVVVWGLRDQRRELSPPVRGFIWERGGLAEVFHLNMAVVLFFGLGAGTIFVFLPTFAEHLGVRTLALFYTAYSVAAIGVRVLGGQLSDVYGRRAVIVPSMFVQAGATALLAVLGLVAARAGGAPILPALFVAGLMSGAAHGFLYPGLAALVTDQTPETQRGVVVGIFSAVFLAGQTSGAFLFGYVAHAVGYTFMWWALTSLLFLGSTLALKLEGR
jgi:MFS family permease